MNNTAAIRLSMIEFCVAIGQDALLVQGAGGNVSWKDGETLWIKASGMCLAHAKEREIFVPVDLTCLLNAIDQGNFAFKPSALYGSSLRPSIETMLHALMPQTIVVHFHAIEVLAYLVRPTWMSDIQERIGDTVTWASIPYKKPGYQLAARVSHAVKANGAKNVLFLQNHGIVVGGNNVTDVITTLNKVIDALRTQPIGDYATNNVPVKNIGWGYVPVADPKLHQLAQDPNLFVRLKSNWALYPDHVVFLGNAAHTYLTLDMFADSVKNSSNLPELVFIKDLGTFILSSFGFAKQAQLRCYYDVLVRQEIGQSLNTLMPEAVYDIMNWDAEKYRIQLVNVSSNG
jgi:rhamnose utilization protein RhaD (predicted bifunctional aldolase and dehydrogenase)